MTTVSPDTSPIVHGATSGADAIQGIDHLEMYVSDARQAAYLFTSTFGFRVTGEGGPETGLTEQRSILLEQADIRLLLTTALSSAHPAADYVARHGDGVAVVAFRVADTSTVYERAISGGADGLRTPTRHGRGDDAVVLAEVSGFGDVIHRLVQRDTPGGSFWPGAIARRNHQPAALAPAPAWDDRLELVDHLAICLPAGRLAATVRFYQEAFGFDEIYSEYIEVGEQGMDSRVVQSPSGGVTFTLLEPDTSRQRGQIDNFLSWHGGPGVQHVALLTRDIVDAVRTLSARGVGFGVTPPSYYDVLEQRLGPIDLPVAALREVGVLVDRDHWGQMFQIFTESMHLRRTLFFELIERHGARTFGTSNIHALYEAKERELSAQRAAAD